MAKVVSTHQILVHAPRQSIFDYVADLTRHPEWSSGQLTIEEVQPGSIAVGKEYRSRGEAAGQKNRPNRVRITEYEPPHRFGFVADDPAIQNISHVFTFTEQEGGVLVRRTMTLPLHPIAAIVFRVLVYPLVGSPAMDKSLALLKTKLEQSR